MKVDQENQKPFLSNFMESESGNILYHVLANGDEIMYIKRDYQFVFCIQGNLLASKKISFSEARNMIETKKPEAI